MCLELSRLDQGALLALSAAHYLPMVNLAGSGQYYMASGQGGDRYGRDQVFWWDQATKREILLES